MCLCSCQANWEDLAVSSFNLGCCKCLSALTWWFPDQLELERELFFMLMGIGGDAAPCKFSSILNEWERAKCRFRSWYTVVLAALVKEQ